MKNIVYLLISLTTPLLFGQKYQYNASLSEIKQSGFCRISLPPEVTSKLNADFGDIRIYDENDIEIPYLLETEKPIQEKELFVEYDIIEKEHFKKEKYTRLVIHNPSKNKIDNMVLRIGNADVRKHLKLNASYDNKTWYVLKDNYLYNSISNFENTSEIRVLNFPLTNYEYFEILIDDFYDKPINILQAGYYDLIKEKGKYISIPNISFSNIKKAKKTFISIPTAFNYIDKIVFSIDKPDYYKREATIYEHHVIKNRKKNSYVSRDIQHFYLESNSTNQYLFSNLQRDTLFVRINNNDNQELHIQDIRLFQLNKYLVADLETGKTYRIQFSNKKVSQPIYDLKYFTDQIPKDLSLLSIINIEKNTKKDKIISKNINFSDYWLWISIIGLISLLAFMSFSMLKDKKNS